MNKFYYTDDANSSFYLWGRVRVRVRITSTMPFWGPRNSFICYLDISSMNLRMFYN